MTHEWRVPPTLSASPRHASRFSIANVWWGFTQVGGWRQETKDADSGFLSAPYPTSTGGVKSQ